jgi:alpha-glucosidase (family GH31 glycosyl hydrolase)
MADAHGTNATMAVAGANVRANITVLTSRILKISIGERVAGAPTSYLPVAPRLPAATAGRIENGGLVTALVSASPGEAGVLMFADHTGRALLRLLPLHLGLAPEARMRLELPGEQHLYGMGGGGQQFDRLGIARRLWNFQANRAQGADMAVPLILSQAGYGLFIDHTARGRIEHGDTNEGATTLEYSAEAGAFDVYFLAGGMRTVLGDLAALLGHATMPPRWALGYLQSTRHFENTEEITGLGAALRERRIPADAVIFLSTYGHARGWNRGVGHLDFEPELFADPAAVLGALHEQHLHTISHEYPVVHEDSDLYAEAIARGYLLEHAYPRGRAATPDAAVYREGQRYIDFSRPDVRAWWWDAHRHLCHLGVAGWWLDGGEGPPTGTARDGDLAFVHNRYDLWRQQAFAEGEARDRPDRRPFLLCRSGGPGMARFGAIPWSGDINTTFETMATQIRIGLNLAMSGIPHWGTDTGGFYSVAPDQGELFVRWLQFSAFCTLFRAHGHVWRRHLPWAYGEAIEAICRDIIEWRYRLMPYSYTLVWQAHRDGLPTMRPLVLNYPDDPNVWELGSQYLWGDDLLVAPVTRRGATHWAVYLPEGEWHDFWTQERYSGPRGVTVEAPLAHVPLFVRGGAIIPLGPVMQYAGEQKLTEITLLTYANGSSSFTLYEDDGETNLYRDGAHAETRFDCIRDGSGVTFRVNAPIGDASLIPAGRRYVLKLHADQAPRGIVVERIGALPNGQSSDPGWWHDGTAFLLVRLPPFPVTVRIEA